MILTRRWLPKSTARRLPLGVTTFLATITLRTHKTTSSLLRPSASIGSPSPTPSRLIVPRATFARSDKCIVDNSAPSDKGNLPNRPIFLLPTGTSLGHRPLSNRRLAQRALRRPPGRQKKGSPFLPWRWTRRNEDPNPLSQGHPSGNAL